MMTDAQIELARKSARLLYGPCVLRTRRGLLNRLEILSVHDLQILCRAHACGIDRLEQAIREMNS